ncbi:icmt-1, partial [Symbiodinium necroappetens]
MLSQLAALCELDEQAAHFPWRSCAAMSAGARAETLSAMRQEWSFCNRFIDTLQPGSQLHTQLGVTRYQPYRDLMIKAESFDFDASRMSEQQSAGFRETVAAFCGCTGANSDALLSSLPSELAFNDVRDCARRGQKSETSDIINLHAIGVKSCTKRPSGCETLELTTADWQKPLRGKGIKCRVHNALKCTDAELGVSAEGLTRHKSNRALTKPHVFHQRLRLLKLLQRRWENCTGDDDERHEHVVQGFKLMWSCRLVPRGSFLQWTASRSEDVRQLVLSSGPHGVLLLPLKAVRDEDSECFSISEYKVPRELVEVGPVDKAEVALAAVTLDKHGKLAWKQSTPFMSLPEFVADHTILEVQASLLCSLCSAMKLKGHSKLSHRRRVEAFLQELGRSQDYITGILEELPEKEAPDAEEDERLEGQTDDEEEEDLMQDLHEQEAEEDEKQEETEPPVPAAAQGAAEEGIPGNAGQAERAEAPGLRDVDMPEAEDDAGGAA